MQLEQIKIDRNGVTKILKRRKYSNDALRTPHISFSVSAKWGTMSKRFIKQRIAEKRSVVEIEWYTHATGYVHETVRSDTIHGRLIYIQLLVSYLVTGVNGIGSRPFRQKKWKERKAYRQESNSKEPHELAHNISSCFPWVESRKMNRSLLALSCFRDFYYIFGITRWHNGLRSRRRHLIRRPRFANQTKLQDEYLLTPGIVGDKVTRPFELLRRMWQ